MTETETATNTVTATDTVTATVTITVAATAVSLSMRQDPIFPNTEPIRKGANKYSWLQFGPTKARFY